MEIGRDSNGALFWRDYIDGKRIKRQNKEWKTKKEAKNDYLKFMAEHKLNNMATSQKNLDEVLEDYRDYISLSKKPSSVLGEYQSLKNIILPIFGNINISQITPRKIQDFQSSLLKRTYISNGKEKLISNRYIDLLQTHLNNFLDYSFRFGHIDKNPFELVPRVKRREFEKKDTMTILTYEQFKHFISVVDDPVYFALFNTLYWCGLRIGEAMALTIDDYKNNELHVYKNFDTKNRVITTTKTDVSRYVSVPNQCALSLNSLIHEYKKSSGEEFSSHNPLFRYDGVIPKGTLDRHKNQYIKQAQELDADFPYFTFHELRHTHVSTLIDLGMESKDIADRLGHSVEMVNNTYGHLFPERKDKLLQKLNELGSE